MDGLDDGAERGALVNLERGAAEEEFAGIGHAGQFVELFDSIADGVKEVIAGERDEIAPCVAGPGAGEDAFVGFAAEGGERLVFFREQAEKEEVRNLLDGIHRVIHAAGPEDIHELVHLLAEA